MKLSSSQPFSCSWRAQSLLPILMLGLAVRLAGAPATLLFEDTFDRGIPGWTAVQPLGVYIDGPMRWQYDVVSGGWVEMSNIYTDNANNAPSATAVMMVNDTVAPTNFTYRARLTAGDDDAFGLVFGFQDAINFYRVTFTRQVSAARFNSFYPGIGWKVDRKLEDVTAVLFGHGTPVGAHSFTNTAARPFDVVISVAGDNLFSLTVFDDPNGANIEWRLVENQPLPGPAGGRVGVFTWGMAGSLPRSFRITNLDLDPVDLTNFPATPLPDWTPVIPPRAGGIDNAVGGHGQGLWSLAIGQNGPYGTLHETSDAFGGNDAAGQVDFIAPSLVAGDTNWTNYVVSARLIPGDDDGMGLLLRYYNETNFYRIALRSQANVTAGVRRGLSVQKVVDGMFEDIFSEPTPQFIPATGVPYDLIAAISGDQFSGNTLRILIVSNPLGVSQGYAYGPIEMGGISFMTVDQGKVGAFSWGMAQAQFDFIRVHHVNGIALQVASAFGAPDPGPGLHDFAPGAEINAWVPSPVEDQPGVRRISTGWTGFGSVPASGTQTNVGFFLDQMSLLNWNWRTEYRLRVSAETGGQVLKPAEEWLPEGTNVTLTAQAEAGYMFVGWAGDTASTAPTLDFILSRPFTTTARFAADSDHDTLPDSWELLYFGNLNSGASDDPDTDGLTNREEYERGSDPAFQELMTDYGLGSRWENVQRDPALPGELIIRDFGSSFRGVWENSNDFRGADDPTFIGASNIVLNVSFDGPRMAIRTNVWDPAWSSNCVARVIFSVGDNDGNCVYFRYQDEWNWYRITVTGENNSAGWRAPFGVSVQKRVNGLFSQLATDPRIATDPTDVDFYKRIRVTVTADGPNFQVDVAGWNADVDPPIWDPGMVTSFFDSDLAEGRLAIGTWGQGPDPNGPTATNPVDDGALIEAVTVWTNSVLAFEEDWTLAPLPNQFPAGWTNAFQGVGGLEGIWEVSAHGTIVQRSNLATPTTGTAGAPKADAPGPIFLAPPPGTNNYVLELGFHPFDDDGIGFVYDYVSPSNYARVLFVSETSAPGRIPQGVNVSRQADGVWSDTVLGDNRFVYRPGDPFAVRFANNNGQYRLSAWRLDDPTNVQAWSWSGPVARADNRFGLAVWGEVDAHFLDARAYGLPARGVVGELRIASIEVTGGNVILRVVNTTGAAFDVLARPEVASGAWAVAAAHQNSGEVSIPLSGPQAFFRLRSSP